MSKKDNLSANKTKLIFLIGIPLLIILSLALIYLKTRREQAEQFSAEESYVAEEDSAIQQHPQEPIGSTSVDCKLRFETPTRNLCQVNAGRLVLRGTVVTAPPGSRLQTSWFQVEPVGTTPRISSFQINTLPYSFSTVVQWPGTKGNQPVKIRALANLYDADGNKYPHCTAGNTTYWLPDLKCGINLESPKQ